LDSYEKISTQTRLVCATFLENIIGHAHYMKKKQAAKVHCNPKMSGFWALNCSQTFKTTWIDIKILPQLLYFKENIKQQILLKTNIGWKRYKPPKLQPSNAIWWLKLNLWTLIDLPKISISWIDLENFPHKLEERAQIFQQVLWNSDIVCKSYNTLNWTWNYVQTLLGYEG